MVHSQPLGVRECADTLWFPPSRATAGGTNAVTSYRAQDTGTRISRRSCRVALLHTGGGGAGERATGAGWRACARDGLARIYCPKFTPLKPASLLATPPVSADPVNSAPAALLGGSVGALSK
jgi:hypothetical protein